MADGVLEVVVHKDRREAEEEGHVVQEVAGDRQRDRDQVEEDLAAPEAEAGHRDLEALEVVAGLEALEVVGVHRGLEARVVVDVCGGSSEQCLL